MRWEWFDEALDAGYRVGLAVEETLFQRETGHQSLKVCRTRGFGRILVLDGIIQTAERDEFIYHEMLAHVPILAHGAAREVCIIGGGDGGMLREVLRHRKLRATMVEIDSSVVEICREFLPGHSAGAFDDPRAELVFADGARFVAETDRRFDVIIVDSTDPVGPGAALFADPFYAACRRCLKPGGILVTQNGVPMFQESELVNTLRSCTRHFADVGCYLAAVPSYWGGVMAFGWACDDPARRDVSEGTLHERFDAAGLDTRYYTPAVHKAAFALPAYLGEIVRRQLG